MEFAFSEGGEITGILPHGPERQGNGQSKSHRYVTRLSCCCCMAAMQHEQGLLAQTPAENIPKDQRGNPLPLAVPTTAIISNKSDFAS